MQLEGESRKAASISPSVPAFRIRKLHSLHARRFRPASLMMRSADNIVRVDEQGDRPGLGDQFGKQLDRLGISSMAKLTSGEVTAWTS